ncbi:hypothetical protein GCK32_017781 [Trichostrongylus colubriformis]|uniref:Secreted protein n=1 Tax=Trichostrongylus colubriformis TaxID=6319 RepID=A0AAN8IQ38_TRICO
MQSWSLLLFLPLTYSRKVTSEENEQIRQDCGHHFLQVRQARSSEGYKARSHEYPFIAAVVAHKGEFARCLHSKAYFTINMTHQSSKPLIRAPKKSHKSQLSIESNWEVAVVTFILSALHSTPTSLPHN